MTESKAKLYEEITELETRLKYGDVSCHEAFNEKLAVCKELHFTEGHALCAANLAKIYLMQNNASKSIDLIREVYKDTKRLKDKKYYALLNNALGSLFAALDDNVLANRYYLIALETYNNLDMPRKKASVLANLGVYFGQNQKNQDKALEYLTKSWEILKGIDDKENWVILHSLGQYYRRNGEPEKAEDFFKESLRIAQEYGNPFGVSMGYAALSRRAEKEGDLHEALRLLNLALEIEEKQGTELFKNHNYVFKAQYLFKLGDTEGAMKICEKLVNEASKPRIRVDAYALMADIYEKQGDFKSAYDAQKLHTSHKNEYNNLESKKHIETTEARFQNRIKETEKELLRLQKYDTEQKAIRAQLNPHFIFNSLNSINKFILTHDIDKASSFLQRFSSLMRKTLEHSELGVISIEEECEFLNEYLMLEQMRFNNAFSFEIKVDEEIESDYIRIPTMLIQPYVENCVKHAMVGLDNGQINIAFSNCQEHCIRCVIEDNGNGWVSKADSKHRSMSTKLQQTRLDVLKELYKVDFQVTITDKSKLDKSQTGTRVEIVFYSEYS